MTAGSTGPGRPPRSGYLRASMPDDAAAVRAQIREHFTAGHEPQPETGGNEYSYSRTYMRRRRYRPGPAAWADRHRTFTVLAAAFLILFAYAAACALVVDRLFPAMAGAYWVAGLSVVALAALLALVLWSRRD